MHCLFADESVEPWPPISLGMMETARPTTTPSQEGLKHSLLSQVSGDLFGWVGRKNIYKSNADEAVFWTPCFAWRKRSRQRFSTKMQA